MADMQLDLSEIDTLLDRGIGRPMSGYAASVRRKSFDLYFTLCAEHGLEDEPAVVRARELFASRRANAVVNRYPLALQRPFVAVSCEASAKKLLPKAPKPAKRARKPKRRGAGDHALSAVLAVSAGGVGVLLLYLVSLAMNRMALDTFAEGFAAFPLCAIGVGLVLSANGVLREAELAAKEEDEQ